MARDAENAKRLQREWYQRNKELVKERSRKWSEENSEKVAESKTKWRQENREKHNAINREWWAENPHKRTAYQGKRRAAKLLRTPKWLTENDLFMIEEAYLLAKIRTELTGFDWHVDHIYPLQGKKVSGLHVPANLQVIPGKENLKKSNKHEV